MLHELIKFVFGCNPVDGRVGDAVVGVYLFAVVIDTYAVDQPS